MELPFADEQCISASLLQLSNGDGLHQRGSGDDSVRGEQNA